RPLPLLITGAVIPVQVQQVYQWQSVNDDLLPVSLGSGVDVEVTLSPAGSEIVGDYENSLPVPETSLTFSLSSLRTPTAIFKDPMAAPIDAIGGPNLENSELPLVFVELAEGEDFEVGDKLGVFIFGTVTNAVAATDINIARYQQIDLPDDVADSATITAGQLGLIENSIARFNDGEMAIGVRLERGDIVSPLRMFDSDPDEAGPQPLLFDITPPTLVGLGVSGMPTAIFQSTARDLVLTGIASEPLARITVTATDGTDARSNLDTNLIAEVASSNVAGLFVARPVSLGVLDPNADEWSFSATLIDRALNEAEDDVTGLFSQWGAVLLDGAPGDDMISVRVFDAQTLLPLPGALVMTHQNNGGSYSSIESQMTGEETGSVDIMGAATGETVLTIDLEDYDLFTFSGVPGSSIDIPLTATAQLDATTEGIVGSPSLTVDITSDTKFMGDTRLIGMGDPLLGVGGCQTDPITFTRQCTWGPAEIDAGQLGGRSFLSTNFDLSVGTFSAGGFLRAFDVSIPAPPALPGGTDMGFFNIQSLLLNADGEEQPIAVTPATITEPDSDNWSDIASDPEVTIEAIGPAMSRGLPVGLGMSFETESETWLILGAYAGVADGIADEDGDDELGELVQKGTIEGDLLFRIEMADDVGNRVGIRPRLSSDLLIVPILSAPNPPTLASPGAGSSTGGSSYDLVFAEVLVDSFGHDGLYKAVLTDANGRSWELWTRDVAGDPGTLTVKVPGLGSLGGTPLSNGQVTARISAFSMPGLDMEAEGDVDAFIWEDVQRDYQYFGHAAEVEFTQGN
ncbi:MAG: hypothetical protein ACI835_001286, partial [Planctomycetota bacterium]